MKVSNRHGELLELLQLRNKLTIPEITEAFQISAATARRDRILLAEQGLVKKVRNGIEVLEEKNRPLNGQGELPLYGTVVDEDEENSIFHFKEKNCIGEAAARIASEFSSCIINSGSTAFLVGKKLCGSRVRIISNYFPLLSYLIANRHPSVVVLGGQYYHDRQLILDGTVDSCQVEQQVDLFFTSGSGLTLSGLYKTDMLSAMAEQRLLSKTNAKLAVVLDSSKINCCRGALAMKAEQIDYIITDKEADEEVIKAYEAMGVRVILV